MTDNPALLSERDRALFETSPDGILIVNDEGIYVDVNDALCAMLQTPREQLVGRPFVEFMPPDRVDDAIAAFAQLRVTGALAMEFPLLRSDGTQINLEWRSRANFLPGLYLCVAHDLTEREEAERALRESDERYRAFMANTTEAIWRFELDEPFSIELPIDEQIDLCYERAYLAECNDAMARMYGFESPSQIVGMRIGDMLVRDNPENVAYLRTFMENGYHLSGAESRETDRDGNEKVFINSLIGIIVDGRVVRAWGMQRDATEEKQLERQRAALLSRLELLADVTSVLGSSLDYDQTLRSIAGAAVPRFADWCFIDVVTENGAVERVVVQHSDPAMVELSVEMERRYPSPADIDIGPRQTIRTGATQTYEIRDEVLVQYAQNDEHLEMARALGFHNGLVVPLSARGRVVGALSFANAESSRTFSADDVQLAEDLGRRAGLAIDNARLYSELDRANRAKDDFLAMLSHELRTPMTATLGWATMLERGPLPAELALAAAQSIAQSTRAQARLIDDLLDVSRIVSGKMQLSMKPVAIADTIAGAVATIAPAADAKEIRLDVRLVDRESRVYGDDDRLRQVFWNLLSNAVKFTPRGGWIDVELTRESDNVRVIVRDSGEGIPQELLPHVFERFRQGDSGASRKHGGLGLGLAIARNLVELHGGTLTVASEGAGRGATFTAMLPALSARRENAAASDAEAPPAPLADLRVLVLEDDASTRAMLVVALRQSGAEVTPVASARDAYAALSHQRFDVLLSDIGLGGEDGIALMHRVRAAGIDVPAIALTAYASSSERDRALAAGFNAWLTKPIEPQALAEEVKKVARK